MPNTLIFNTTDETQFADLFGTEQPSTQPAFSIQGQEEDTDLFKVTPAVEEPKEGEEPKDVVTPPVEGDVKEGDSPVEGSEEVDILEDDKKTPGRKPKYDFSDINGYFQDRFKSGKLIPLVDEEDKQIELKTPEDFDMVLEQNVDYQVQQKVKELETTWYQKKSSAFRAVAEYAELVDDVQDIIPFIQGVTNIQSVAQVDEKSPEGAEQIVRYYKQRTGTPADIIEDEIESLKTSDKLLSAAGKLKPAILQQETVALQKMKAAAEAEDLKYWQMVQDYEKSARGVIQQPLFGAKLKQDEQSEIYNLIAVPNEEQEGYAIYTAIDKLYETKNFDMLKKVAFLINKEEQFLKYASQGAVAKTAADVQKKIRLSTSPKGSSTGMEDPSTPEAPRIKVGEGQRTFGKWRQS